MSKEHICRLAAIMESKGIEQVVVSPGSRNAPVIILFGRSNTLRMLSVADERSAGFFALGLAMQSRKTVALLCTSGSAVLNYAPAIAEAYYQNLPLLVLTADRPIELIDQGDSQTIRQTGVFSSYIRKSFNLPAITTEGERWFTDRIINEAIDRTCFPVPGPVQLNIPLDEPLYDLNVQEFPSVKIINYVNGSVVMSDQSVEIFREKWNSASSRMVIAGQMYPDAEIKKALVRLAEEQGTVVLTETTSNLKHPSFINCIDRTLALIPPSKNKEHTSDILITFGGAVISKKVKAMLRNMKPANHWHISTDPEQFHFDTYKSLTATINADPLYFISQLLTKGIKQSVENSFFNNWHETSAATAVKHSTFAEKVPYGDFMVYHKAFQLLPPDTAVHLGNSTPVRYAQLFDHPENISFYGNRGTSGIDGCTSTAAGFAFNYNRLTLLITGDIGFFYDSNALWNHHLSANLRILLINNGGGNIFRIIDGPAGHAELEPFIETRHDFRAKGIAASFNIQYYLAENELELNYQLPVFLGDQPSGRPAILEVVTDNILSAQTLKDYFSFLRS